MDACNIRTWEVGKAGGSGVQGHPQLLKQSNSQAWLYEVLSQNNSQIKLKKTNLVYFSVFTAIYSFLGR